MILEGQCCLLSCRTEEESDPDYDPSGLGMSDLQIVHQSAALGSARSEPRIVCQQGPSRHLRPSSIPKLDSPSIIYRPQGHHLDANQAEVHQSPEHETARQQLGSPSFPPGWTLGTNPGAKTVEWKPQIEALTEMQHVSADGRRAHSMVPKQGKIADAYQAIEAGKQIMMHTGSGSSQSGRVLNQALSIPAPHIVHQASRYAAQVQQSAMPLIAGEQEHDEAAGHPTSKCRHDLAERLSQNTLVLVSKNGNSKEAYERAVAELGRQRARADGLERLLEQHVASVEAATSAWQP